MKSTKGKGKRTHLEMLQEEYQLLPDESIASASSESPSFTSKKQRPDPLSVFPTPDARHQQTTDLDLKHFTQMTVADAIDNALLTYEDQGEELQNRVVLPRLMNQVDLQQCMQLLEGLSTSNPHAEIDSVLFEVEEKLSINKKEVQQISRPEASDILVRIETQMRALEQSLREWRSRHPNISPIKIQNDNAFLDPTSAHLVPTLIAYALALSQRLLSGASKVAASATLQIMRLYGNTLAGLGVKTTMLQTRSLDDIPNKIETVQNRLNFGIVTEVYAVCPRCNFPYAPQNSPISNDVVYPEFCTNRSPLSSPPCDTPLLDSKGRPVKAYEYYPFPQWFAHFVAQPGVQQYAKEFCEAVRNEPAAPSDKVNTWDGDIYRLLRGPDGKLFVEGGDEGRFFFLLHVDFFSSEGSSGRGKHRSTGVISA
ncbi:hypothetical protein GYMLUDRAFT_244249 [Collybiopsis luxurians FD-317 M1]|uniref:Uncharacterized protein n=1 Tax=Collybiopsis luxurians FD-317 M1 TaxID=944289 RepID=A0A0D0CDX5_9AGAR|nr:hypothetical protein GYMLUDRAFT_244249 [Collybiopsis luxurians FD-317 M1]